MTSIAALLIQAALQYGIPAAEEIIAVMKNPAATVADVEALFAKIKTYEQYNIPNLPTAVTPAG